MKRRYHDSNRSAGTAASSGAKGNRGGLTPRVARHERQPVHQGQRPVVGVEPWQHVGHRGEHGEAGPPPGFAVADAEGDAGADGGERGLFWSEHLGQPEDSLGDHEGQALLQAFLQPPQMAAGRVGFRAQYHDDLTVRDLDPVGPDIVGERVQSAT